MRRKMQCKSAFHLVISRAETTHTFEEPNAIVNGGLATSMQLGGHSDDKANEGHGT